MEKMKLSVIVPVYQAESYLDRCISSILGASYKNIELILVDDGSPDKSPEICDKYAKEDDRVKVIHQKNAGGGFARNTGIRIAQGEYIAFCDNDDRVPFNAYAIMMEKAEETSADVVRGTIERTYEDTGEIRLWKRSANDMLSTQVIGLLGGIYKTDFLRKNELCFEKWNMGPDVYFMAQVINCANDIQYVDEVTYHYIMRKSDCEVTSAMQKADRVFDYYFDDFVWREKILEYIRNSSKLYYKYKGQLSYFCKRIDENWLNFNAEQQAKCFEVLRNIISLIEWEEQEQKAEDYLQVNLHSFLKMDVKKFTGKIWMKVRIYRPIMKKIRR